MGNTGKGPDVILNTQDIGNLCHRDELYIRVHIGTEFVFRDGSIRLWQNVAELRALFLAQLLPREHVAVMLHDGDDDFIAFLYKCTPIGIGYEVQAFRCISCKHDFLVRTCIEKLPHGLAGILIGLGCLDGQLIKPTHRIRIFLGVVLHHGVKHTLRLLCGCAVVQIGEAAIEDRELSKDFLILTLTFFLRDLSHCIVPPYDP